MIIVVEGPDGAGKTRLIEDLRRESHRHFIDIRRNGQPTHDSQVFSASHWLRNLPPALDFVLDRHPGISEAIYGPLFRGRSLVSTEPSEMAQRLDTVDWLIYCRPPSNTIAANCLSHNQMDGVNDHVPALVEAYDYYMRRLSNYFKFIRYDYTGVTVPRTLVGDLKVTDDVQFIIDNIWGHREQIPTHHPVVEASRADVEVPGTGRNEPTEP